MKVGADHQDQTEPEQQVEEPIDAALNEISDELKQKYRTAANKDIADLEQDVDSEYGDIAQRMIDRRKRGIELAGDEEELNEYNKKAINDAASNHKFP